MVATALSLVQSACYEANIPAPTALAGATDPAVLQLLNLFYATGRELRQRRWWPQLKKKYYLPLRTNKAQYKLPQDFYAALPSTHWDQANKWELNGPMSDREWNYRIYGYVTVENRKAYRILGPDMNPNSDLGQFYLNPTPTTTSASTMITFEYITRSWLMPPNWTPDSALTGTIYRNVNGNIYRLYSNGTTSPNNAPTMFYGLGWDGGILWQYINPEVWGPLTAYDTGDYVTNGGNLYLCIVGGGSETAGPGPTGTGSAIIDRYATWQYVPTVAWFAETAYTIGSYVTNAGKYYLNVTPNNQGNTTQKAGKYAGPNWTSTTVPDNTAGWEYISAPYETLVTDSDLCLFDEEIMIAGLKWRFLRARGLEYADVKAEYELMTDTAVNRWISGKKITLADQGYTLAGLHPRIPEGGFG